MSVMPLSDSVRLPALPLSRLSSDCGKSGAASSDRDSIFYQSVGCYRPTARGGGGGVVACACELVVTRDKLEGHGEVVARPHSLMCRPTYSATREL